jgi:hypothetical protein
VAIPSGLIEIFKEKALKLRQEFQELKCCDSTDDILNRQKLEKCLLLAKELNKYYEEIYLDIWNDTGLQHEIYKLSSRKNEFVNTYKKYEENPKSQDVFKIKRCLELACDYMSEFDSLLHDLKIQIFE